MLRRCALEMCMPLQPPTYLRQPAEWALHDACWVAPPHLRHEWLGAFDAARQEFVELLRGIADVDPHSGQQRGEALNVLVPNELEAAWLRDQLPEVSLRTFEMPYGDSWLRDSAPIFVHDADGEVSASCFRFNGWGGKYPMPGDEDLSPRVAAASGTKSQCFDWILEGGSIDVDGEGTALTTRDCLLDPLRNVVIKDGRQVTARETDVEPWLRRGLGIDHCIWLNGQLHNDHTDGHIDTLARFVAPGVVACMEPSASDDPNGDVLRSIMEQLQAAHDVHQQRLELALLPSPGRVESSDGEVLAASYCNFYIANTVVIVPCYGVPNDDAAVAAIAKLFPTRRAVGLPAKAILHGGGAWHCVTQQQPASRRHV